MPLLEKILHKLNGLHYNQEYLCLAKETMRQPLFVYIADKNKMIEKDITGEHLFVGYKPLIIAIFETGTTLLSEYDEIEIILSTAALLPGSFVEKEDIIAKLLLRKKGSHQTGDTVIYYFEGVKGSHKFIPAFNAFIFQLSNHLFNRKPGNVFLKGTLYTQVQIAYSVPRKISLITVSSNGLYNLFPTDLHGQADSYYIGSLRQGGKACEQVLAAGKILVSDVDVAAFKQAYAMGKNHMQELKEKTAFDFSGRYSRIFHLPLPNNVIQYKELELDSWQNHGIHTLFLFKIINTEIIEQSNATLAHIHNMYATWRYMNDIPTDYFFR